MLFDRNPIALFSAIYILSIALLAASLATIFLELNVVNAFIDYEVQESKSSIAEWRWVSLNPVNVDAAPTNAIFTAAAVGIIAAVVASAWATVLLCRFLQKNVSLLFTSFVSFLMGPRSSKFCSCASWESFPSVS